MVGEVFVFFFDLAIFIITLLCWLGLLPFLKLRILQEINVPTVEMKFEYVSTINILSIGVIYFRLGEVITYWNYFPAIRESVSFTAPVLFIKIVAVIISILLIIIVESFAFSLLLYNLKRSASYATILWIISIVNFPTIFFVIIRIFDTSLGFYGRNRFLGKLYF